MTEFQLFRCCQQHPLSADPDEASPPPSAGGWLAPIGEKCTVHLSGPLIEGRLVKPSRSRSVALHEASHAAVAIAIGVRVISATIDAQPHVTGGRRLTREANIIFFLAGLAGEAWARSELARVPDDELRAWVAGIRNLGGGGCDRCVAVRQCVVGTRHASDDVVVAAFRYLENLTGMIVRSPLVWAAITELADALMRRGTLGTRAIRTICRRNFEPGAFAHLVNPNSTGG